MTAARERLSKHVPASTDTTTNCFVYVDRAKVL
jgi:hypothetical protein